VHRNIIPVVKPTRCTNVPNLFLKRNVHVLDGLSVHHREYKTVHTATGICQTDTAVCLLAGICQTDTAVCLLAGICQTGTAVCLLAGIVKQVLLSAC